jgi:hypothetical protein
MAKSKTDTDLRCRSDVGDKSLANGKAVDGTVQRESTTSHSSDIAEKLESKSIEAAETDLEKSPEAIIAPSDPSSFNSPSTDGDPSSSSATDSTDENTVWWDGDDDPANPQNWSASKKWGHVGVVSLITFIVYVLSCRVCLFKYTLSRPQIYTP